jgi:uncharacterized protein DUF262
MREALERWSMQKPERSLYSAQDFAQWKAAGGLDLTPKFQRRGVWSSGARSFFVDTIIRGMPIPPIYIRLIQSADGKGTVRQVIDGQQRVSCVLDFLGEKFRLSRTMTAPWAGKSFEQLSNEERNSFLHYTFAAEIFRGISDNEVLGIFSRLNTYSVPLNGQELRNGKYFGLFKQSAYSLALEHLEFWRLNGVFSERSIARMLEVELTSELLIAEVAGMQDKKKSIDQFYATYDEEFPGRDRFEKRFRESIDTISETFDNRLSDSEFARGPLFYSLFCAVYHYQHGLPNEHISTPRTGITKRQRGELADAVDLLSPIIAAGRAGQPVPPQYSAFVNACLRQTDNIRPRQERFVTLFRRAFPG